MTLNRPSGIKQTKTDIIISRLTDAARSPMCHLFGRTFALLRVRQQKVQEIPETFHVLWVQSVLWHFHITNQASCWVWWRGGKRFNKLHFWHFFILLQPLDDCDSAAKRWERIYFIIPHVIKVFASRPPPQSITLGNLQHLMHPKHKMIIRIMIQALRLLALAQMTKIIISTRRTWTFGVIFMFER